MGKGDGPREGQYSRKTQEKYSKGYDRVFGEIEMVDKTDYKQLVRDMWENLYALYHRDFCICHGEPREGYEYLPELLKRIKKARNEGGSNE